MGRRRTGGERPAAGSHASDGDGVLVHTRPEVNRNPPVIRLTDGRPQPRPTPEMAMPAVMIRADGRTPARARRRPKGAGPGVPPTAPLDPDRRQRPELPARRSTSSAVTAAPAGGGRAVRPRESQVRPQGPSRRRRPAVAQASGRPVLALDAVTPRPVALPDAWAGQARTILHGRGGNGRRTVRPRKSQRARRPIAGRRVHQLGRTGGRPRRDLGPAGLRVLAPGQSSRRPAKTIRQRASPKAGAPSPATVRVRRLMEVMLLSVPWAVVVSRSTTVPPPVGRFGAGVQRPTAESWTASGGARLTASRCA